MLAEQDLKKIFHKIVRQFSAKIHFGGSDISINFFDHASKVSLSTPIYLGGNYIPKSVRECACQKMPMLEHGMKATVEIDEDNFRVVLNYLGPMDPLEDSLFESLVQEFGALAEEWKVILDERDKNDLVYIHAR